jgi:hypothetical protein
MIPFMILAVAALVYAYFFWPVAMMSAPGAAGIVISRAAFEAVPKLYFYLLRTFGARVAGFMFGGFPAIVIRAVCFLFRFVFGALLPGFLIPAVRFVFRFACGVAGFVFWGVFAQLLAIVVCYLVGLLMASYCSSSPECTTCSLLPATGVSGIVEYISSEPSFDMCHFWCLVKCAMGM